MTSAPGAAETRRAETEPAETEPAETETEYFPVAGAPEEALDLGRLVLRRWSVDDLDLLEPVVERSVAHLTPFMGWAADSTRESLLEYLERSTCQWDAHETFQYSMRRPDDDAVVGACGLMSCLEPGALEIGYWVAVDQVRHGYATLATAGLTRAGFALPGIERVEVHHDLANDASGRVPARLGFTRVRERAVPPRAAAETGTHVVWAVRPSDWATGPGRAVLPGRG